MSDEVNLENKENPASEIKNDPEFQKNNSFEEIIKKLSSVSFEEPVRLTPDSYSVSISGNPYSLKEEIQNTLSEAISIKLLLPSFISYIELSINDPSDIKISYEAKSNTFYESEPVTLQQKKVRFYIGKVISQIKITKASYFVKAKFGGFKIFGFISPNSSEWIKSFSKFQEEVHYCRNQIELQYNLIQNDKQKIENDRSNLKTERDDHESKIQSIRSQIREIEDVYSNKLTEKKNAESEAIIANEALSKLKESYSLIESTMQETTKKHSELTGELDEKVATSSLLTKNIAELKAKFDELNRDVTLFAVDLKGYGEHGKRQSRWYIGIIIICILATVVVTYFAYSELSVIWNAIVLDPQRISWSLIAITRFGMLLIFTAALGGITSIGYAFVKRLIQIHERALDLSAISILARDVTDSTISEGTSSQKMAVFYAARMSLVRNLLSGLFEKLATTTKDEREIEITKFNEAEKNAIIKIFEKLT